jgi:hypothetical protein
MQTQDTTTEHTWDVVEKVITRKDGWILQGVGMNRLFISRASLTAKARAGNPSAPIPERRR